MGFLFGVQGLRLKGFGFEGFQSRENFQKVKQEFENRGTFRFSFSTPGAE